MKPELITGGEAVAHAMRQIDPDVVRVAKDERLFQFLSQCRSGVPKVALGDARLRLAEAPDGYYDVIVLDAFSSDAIPIHLLTREALRGEQNASFYSQARKERDANRSQEQMPIRNSA